MYIPEGKIQRYARCDNVPRPPRHPRRRARLRGGGPRVAHLAAAAEFRRLSCRRQHPGPLAIQQGLYQYLRHVSQRLPQRPGRLLLPARLLHRVSRLVSSRWRNPWDSIFRSTTTAVWHTLPRDFCSSFGPGILRSSFRNATQQFVCLRLTRPSCTRSDHVSGRRQVDVCGLGKKATINDPMYRSVNRNATAVRLDETQPSSCGRPCGPIRWPV